MPAYEEALAADPTAFVDCATEMSAAGNDLTDHRAAYDTTVTTINDGWQDQANAAFNEDVDLVDEHVDGVASQVGEAAEVLSTGGSAMASQVEQLKATDAAYKGAGFVVQPAPKVELGPVHWAAIAAAGPFGPVLQAVFQARADEGTMQLTTGLAVLTAADVATGTALTAAGEALEPLEDKGPAATDCLTVKDDGEDGNIEKVEQRADVKDETDTGKDTGKDDKGKEDEKEDDDEKDKDGKDKEDEDKEDEDQDQDEKDQDKDEDQPGEQQPQPEVPQPDREQPENEIPGFEPPDPGPEVPDFTADPFVPGGPDLGDPWKPSELEESEVPAGGLASGGGGGLGGGGLGSTDVPSGTTGTGSGGAMGLVGTPAGGGPAGVPGGRPGVGGGMLGAPGARGPLNPDEEYERESFLTEDPEDDVWGIGTDEGNPYVDYQEEPAMQSDLPPLPPVEELPPFTFPDFDLPEPGKP
ncbi:WXG100 family type VII secretion target [Glycomyces algeriensis]|uniref:Uncharacterized protein n=1 Tax=Glycomyces algeriensis TaxID=256037 RepID=A0A9W6LIR0_9ACTN|nr:hypothetical protein [Glycomyces algeriensis]MDA1365779.1 hypothetical protein [Glycomyces algeriensis]MDR7351468.1 uncharacterized protein YukE [Glycomyces algeriensis]GLI44189.1 hypothetical protein GALLR39Z86_40390 [Glycomyces algeriensis]